MESIGNSAESIAQAFIRAINRQDVDRLAALMSPSHRFIDSLGKVIEGRDKMRKAGQPTSAWSPTTPSPLKSSIPAIQL